MRCVTALAEVTDPSRRPATIIDVSRDSLIFLRFLLARRVSLTEPCGLLFPLLYLSSERASPLTAALRHYQLSDSSKKKNRHACVLSRHWLRPLTQRNVISPSACSVLTRKHPQKIPPSRLGLDTEHSVVSYDWLRVGNLTLVCLLGIWIGIKNGASKFLRCVMRLRIYFTLF